MDKHTLAEYIRKLKIALALVLATVCTGTAGFMMIENYNFTDSLYMTIITMTTIGYGEVHTLGAGGRYFNMFIIITGVGILGYSLSLITQVLIAAQFHNIRGRRAMQKEIDQLKDHYILCGYGRIGRTIAMEFVKAKKPFVIVEPDQECFDLALQDEVLAIHGSAEKDDILQSAGIANAGGLITTAGRDDVNVFITLSARSLNPTLVIIARSEDESTEIKLRRAGADRICSPYRGAGRQIAMSVLRPNVLDFVEGVTDKTGAHIQLVEVTVSPESQFVGKSLIELGITRKFKIIIITIYRKGGEEEAYFSPAGETVINADDLLLVVGLEDKLESFAAAAGGTESQNQ